jgi:hypothetical protein
MLNETSEVLLGAVELSQGEGRQEFAAQVAELVGRTRPCIALDLGEMGESVYWVDVATRRSGTWVGSEWTAPLLARGTLSDFASSPYVFIADNADSLSDTDLLGLTRAVHKAGSSAFLLLVDRLRSAPLRRYLSFVLSPRSGLGGALQTLPFAERFHDLWGTFTDRIGDLRVATRLHARLPPERLATILGSSDPPPSNALFDAALETLTPEEWRVVDVLFTGPSPGTHRDIVQLLAPCSQESMDWMRDVGLLGEHQGRLRLASAWRARPAMDRFNAPSIDLRSFWERSVAVLRFILEQPPAECREGALWIEAVSLRRALCDAHRRQAPPAAISTVELAAMTLLAFTLDLDDLPEQSWLKHPISGFHARFARVFRSEERLRRGWVSIETALGDRAVLPQLRAELVAQIGDLLPEPGMKPPG